LRFIEELPGDRRLALLHQIEAINFSELDELIERHVRTAPTSELPHDLEPAAYYSSVPDGAYDPVEYRNAGETLIREGRVAAFTVAGGQGTRLGWRGPKGTYPSTNVTGKPLFRVVAEQIIAAEKKYNVAIPWYIMTSPMNDAETRSFFLDNNCFGLMRSNIFMFPQGVMPCLELETGRILLAEKYQIARNPDGHGGSMKALTENGAIEDMSSRGIEHISYFQIDNPLIKVIDPLFIGLHAKAPDSSAQMSSKMVAKAGPEEKVGVFCQSEGKTMVVEYSDLPETLANQRDDDGALRFKAGSIAIHMIGLDFIKKLTQDRDHFRLPYHRAVKKVSCIDLETGQAITPDQPNGVKLETFVFDALPLAESSIVFETLRVEEFAPIKNREGVDSPSTSHQIQSDRNGNWLAQHGVEVPRDVDGHVTARIEISPLTATEPSDLVSISLPQKILPGQDVVL
ncbi:MAG: UDPGP type 1 family protein, partial [Planctomycetota bacterium]|nr:UDPGP type 1 family protein [Planctomycetota bacterium]